MVDKKSKAQMKKQQKKDADLQAECNTAVHAAIASKNEGASAAGVTAGARGMAIGSVEVAFPPGGATCNKPMTGDCLKRVLSGKLNGG